MDWWEEARLLEPRVVHVAKPRLERPWTCSCGRSFKSRRGLSSHRTHCAVWKAVWAWQVAAFLDTVDAARAQMKETIDTRP